MEELQVPTRPIAVELFTDRGEKFRGEIYATELPFHTHRVGELMQTLNDDRSFLPFRASKNEKGVSIVNKRHVTRIRVEGDPEQLLAGDAEAPHEHSHACTLLLADGARVAGEVTVDTPPSLSRLVDKLNQAERFMRVTTETGIELIQTLHVVHVD